MPIAAHFVHQPDPETRQRYEAAWARLIELDAGHPHGRLSHTSWIIGRELHVLDVWESQDKLDAFFEQSLREVLDDFGLVLSRPPEIGDVVRTSAHDRTDPVVS